MEKSSETQPHSEILRSLIKENLQCVICMEILKDPVQCVENEHHFCRECIHEHLTFFNTCPTCKDELSVEMLRKPQRFLVDVVDNLTIIPDLETMVDSCDDNETKDNHERRELLIFKAEMMKIRLKQQEILLMMRGMSLDGKKMLNKRYTPTLSTNAQIIVTGGGLKSSMIFDVAHRTWQRKADMSRNRQSACSVLYQGHMIVVGGRNGNCGVRGCPTDTMEVLDLEQENAKWVNSQIRLPKPCNGHACVVHEDCLLVTGGHLGSILHKISDSVYEMMLTSPFTIRLHSRLPNPLYHHGAVVINGKVYIFGGQRSSSHNDITSDVHVFDQATNTWTRMQPLSYAVTQMGVTVWNDNIIILGGKGGHDGAILDKALMYNITTGCSSLLPNMMKKRCGCTAVTVGDNVFAVGGLGDGTGVDYLKSVEYFSFTCNVWTEVPSMNEGRYLATAVVI